MIREIEVNKLLDSASALSYTSFPNYDATSSYNPYFKSVWLVYFFKRKTASLETLFFPNFNCDNQKDHPESFRL